MGLLFTPHTIYNHFCIIIYVCVWYIAVKMYHNFIYYWVWYMCAQATVSLRKSDYRSVVKKLDVIFHTKVIREIWNWRALTLLPYTYTGSYNRLTIRYYIFKNNESFSNTSKSPTNMYCTWSSYLVVKLVWQCK